MSGPLLVTGGCGFIGSEVVRQAIAAGERVVNLDALTYAANPQSLDAVASSPLYAFEEVDLRDAEAVARTVMQHRPRAIVHLAAETHVDRSIDGPSVFVETNVNGTVNLLTAARTLFDTLEGEARDGFRFLHVSTDEVYGALGPTGRFSEASPYRPNSPYAASKAAADMMVRAWHRTYGLPALISNCSNNYGPCQNPEKLIPAVILNARAGRPIPVYGDGSNVRDWLHVADHARALMTLLAAGRPGETYTIGGDAESANIDLVRTICAALDDACPDGAPHDRLITFVTDRPGHDFRYAIDSARIRAETGWAPAHDLAAGIRDTVAWYLANEAWCEAALDRVPDGERLARLGTAARP